VTQALVLCLLASATTLHAQPPTAPQARAFVHSLLVPSPYRIGDGALSGEIRYRVTFSDGIVREIPSTGEQTARGIEGAVEVSVCRDCRGDFAMPEQAPSLSELTANAWVDSDNRQIVAFARRHAGRGDADRRMTRLADAVRRHMDGPIDFSAYQSASAALQARGGDCTEFALLLAATGRAAGIPTRVVHGLAYASRFTGQPHVFGPHSWVQAWDGERWRSYDAGLGRFDAGHIALRVGGGTPQELAGLADDIRRLRIVAAAGIRASTAIDDD